MTNLSTNDLGYIALAAVRYQLPRMTYGSGIVADVVCAIWPDLDPIDREIIVREVREAMDTNTAGMPCDRAEWARVLALGAARATPPAGARGEEAHGD